MIATGLIFLLGVLLATFVALLLLPIVWRKAQRLARRDFEATIPTTASEIQAGFDRVRAEAAMATRREELKSAEIRERAARERAEAGRIVSQNADLRARARILAERVEQLEEELKDLRSVLAGHEEENGRLDGALRESEHDLLLRVEEMDALAIRFRELTEIAEERKLHIVATETRLQRVTDDLAASERRVRDLQDTADRLRADLTMLEGNVKRERGHSQAFDEKVARLNARLAERDEELAQMRLAAEVGGGAVAPAQLARSAPSSRSNWGTAAEASPASSASLDAAQKLQAALAKRPPGSSADAEEERIRERISDIAARVIRMTAIAEGPESPISRLLEEPDGAGGRDADRPSLADRVRLLMEADERQTGRAGERDRQPADSAAE